MIHTVSCRVSPAITFYNVLYRQDKTRTESYRDFILNNPTVFKDKVTVYCILQVSFGYMGHALHAFSLPILLQLRINFSNSIFSLCKYFVIQK